MSRYTDILMHTVICLLALGIIMVYSASINPFSVHLSGLRVLVSQVTWLFVGFFALFISSHINHRKLLVLSKLILIFSILEQDQLKSGFNVFLVSRPEVFN